MRVFLYQVSQALNVKLKEHPPLQLFILDVAAKYKLPDIDVVLTSAGKKAHFGPSCDCCQAMSCNKKLLYLTLFQEAQALSCIDVLGKDSLKAFPVHSTKSSSLFLADNCPDMDLPLFGSVTRCPSPVSLFMQILRMLLFPDSTEVVIFVLNLPSFFAGTTFHALSAPLADALRSHAHLLLGIWGVAHASHSSLANLLVSHLTRKKCMNNF